MSFFKRLFRSMITKSSGKATAGGALSGVPIVVALNAFGIPIPVEIAAAIPGILSLLTAFGKDK